MPDSPQTETGVESNWRYCLGCLEREIPDQQLNTWIRPLLAEEDEAALRLYAPNRFVLDWVRDHFAARIRELLASINPEHPQDLELSIGRPGSTPGQPAPAQVAGNTGNRDNTGTIDTRPSASNLNKAFTFDTFVEGKSNQLARAASTQVVENPGGAYNPLFLYGGVGLGKTHLMHAIGNRLIHNHPGGKVLYLHSERFVADMVKALQHNAINEFKRHYRGVDALLIDDIQFFAGKDRSQEEFFHTFNALLEGEQQIIMTCDRYPKEVNGLEERLKSRFGWGLTIAIEPPELETRVAILVNKASQEGVELPNEVAFFIAKRIRSNIREGS